MGIKMIQVSKKIPLLSRMIPAICLAVSLIGAGFVFLGDLFIGDPGCQVVFEYSGESNTYFTQAQTVGGFLKSIGLENAEFDSVTPSKNSPLKPGLVITFDKAVAIMLADGSHPERKVMCPGDTVCDLIEYAGLGIGPLDRVKPSLDAVLTDGMRVEISRVEVLDVTNETEIKPGLEIIPDPELPRGHMEEVSGGSPGLKENTTRHYYLNGEETVAVEIGSRVVREPVTRTARVGVRSTPALGSRGGFVRTDYSDVRVLSSTAYDPGPGSCGASADGKTATGHIATKGVCAVDPRVIPLGTELWVEGYGYALACDVGGAIKGNRIDLCFDTRAEAINWGRRDVVVYILSK